MLLDSIKDSSLYKDEETLVILPFLTEAKNRELGYISRESPLACPE